MTRTTVALADDGDDDRRPDAEQFFLEAERGRLLKRRTAVMFLRNGGVTWPAIAKELGISENTARKDYSVVCHDINREDPADVVARHRAVIFDIQRANYPAMMAGGTIGKDAAATILRALERESKLLGLDSPTKILAAANTEDFANEAARLITLIEQHDPDTLKELTRGRRRQEQIIDVTVEPDEGSADPSDEGSRSQGASVEPVGQPVADGAAGGDGDPGVNADQHPGSPDEAPSGKGEAGHPDAGGQPTVGGVDHGHVDDADGWSNIG